MSWKNVVGWGSFWLFLLAFPPIRADELVAKTGERLTGRILSETPEAVEFESAAFGKLRVEKKDISRLERTAPTQPDAPAPAAAAQAAPSDQAQPPSGTDPSGTAMNDPSAQDNRADAPVKRKFGSFFDRINILKKWNSNLTLGLWYRRGQDSDNNTEIRFRSERMVPGPREYLLEYRYYRKDNVASDGAKTVDDDTTLGEFRFRQKLRSRWFFQANSRYYRDPTIELLHEMTLTGGLGYKIVDRPTFKLSAIPAIGPQYADYGPAEQGWHFVVGGYEDLQWDLTKTFKVRQSVYFFQDPFNRASHALRFHLEQVQNIGRFFNFGVSYDYTFDGEVGAHIKQNQQRLGINFGMEF